jgi:hypothetical protein
MRFMIPKPEGLGSGTHLASYTRMSLMSNRHLGYHHYVVGGASIPSQTFNNIPYDHEIVPSQIDEADGFLPICGTINKKGFKRLERGWNTIRMCQKCSQLALEPKYIDLIRPKQYNGSINFEKPETLDEWQRYQRTRLPAR